MAVLHTLDSKINMYICVNNLAAILFQDKFPPPIEYSRLSFEKKYFF